MNSTTTAVLILHYRDTVITQACLKRVLEAEKELERHFIFIVDNSDEQDFVPEPCLDRSYITILKTGRNLGYAGGMNVGIREALRIEPDFLFLLNNDAFIDGACISQLRDFLCQTENAGIVSPLILYKDKPNRIWSTGSKIYPSLGRTRDLYHNCPLRSFSVSTKVHSVTGCAMMVRADVFREIGLFDETYFAYYEDVDFCHRARLYGYDVYFCPFARVYHSVSSATKLNGSISKTSDYYMIKNRIYFMQKYSRKIKLYIFYGLLFPEMIFFIVKNGIRFRFDRIAAFLAGISDAFTQKIEEEFDSKQTGVSACIITRNAEKTIGRCLMSLVGVVDEIILLDSGSTDKTLSTAKGYTDQIYSAEFQRDFSKLRNEAAAYTTNPWILALDADEFLSDEMKNQIKHLTSAKKIWGFFFKRINFYKDKVIRFGYSGMDSVLRLYRKNGSFFYGRVHERVITEGPTEKTSFHLFHRQNVNNFTLLSFKTKWRSYIDIEAEEKAEQTVGGTFPYAAAAPFVFVAVFFKEFFILGSLFDGIKGLRISFLRALYSFSLLLAIHKKKKC